MKLWIRVVLYLGGGGLIITWIDPPTGLLRYALIGALIVGAAYVDAWLFRARAARPGRNVVSMAALRRTREKRQAAGGLAREKRVLVPVYTGTSTTEVESLLELLRAEGFNPMMVSRSAVGEETGHSYEVRLPEREVPKARPVIQFFQLRSARHLS